VLKIGSTDRLGNDIILAKAGKLDAARKEYYDISDQALLASFNKEKKALQVKLEKAQLTQKRFEEQFSALSDQYFEQQKSLHELSDLFARVNFDDVSAEYKQAFDLFEQGKVDESLKILESVKLLARMEKRLKEKKRIEAAGNVIAAQKETNEREIREDLQGLQLQGELYVLTFKMDKAERLYDQMLRIDSTDLKNLRVVSDFFRKNHFYNKAMHSCSLMLSHPQVENWEVGNTYVTIGDMNKFVGNLQDAVDSYTKSCKIFEDIISSDSTQSYFVTNLAISYGRVGGVYLKMSNLPIARPYLEKHFIIYKYLLNHELNNVYFMENYALSCQGIGILLGEKGEVTEALVYIQEFNRVMLELCKLDTTNIEYKSWLANSYSKIGGLYGMLEKEQKAMDNYIKAYVIMNDLQKTNPQSIDINYSLARYCKAVGESYRYMSDLTCIKYIERCIQLTEKLHNDFSLNAEFLHELAQSHALLGIVNSDLGISKMDQSYFQKSLMHNLSFNKLSKELCKISPDDATYKLDLATSYMALGVSYSCLNDIKETKKYLNESKKLINELISDSPEITRHKKFLDTIKQLMNMINQLEDDIIARINEKIQTELDIFTQYQLRTELCDTLRRRVALKQAQKSDLSIALSRRAWAGIFLNKFKESEADVREGLALNSEITFLYICLAPALLFQGKREAALKEYEQWKNQPFLESKYSTCRQRFLEDLDTFEKAGVIPPERRADVEAARALLKK